MFYMLKNKDILNTYQDKLIGKNKEEVILIMKHGYNDINADVWMYRINDKSLFFFKKYLYIFFIDKIFN